MSDSLDKARKRADVLFPKERRTQLAEAVADYDGQEVSGRVKDLSGEKPRVLSKAQEDELMRWFFGRFEPKKR